MKRTIGIEREWFILSQGRIVPAIGHLLPILQAEAQNNGLKPSFFGYELFAGQIEDRTPPVIGIKNLITALKRNEKFLRRIGKNLGYDFICREYVTEEELGSLVVNPFDERHKNIWSKITKERRISASQVAAIHVHIGVSLSEAKSILNYCRKDVIDQLSVLGDNSNGRRLRAYRNMAGVYGDPPFFNDNEELLSYIDKAGGERDVWDMVRYKPSTNTVEFRMFGATESYKIIEKIVLACLEVVRTSLK